MYGNVSKNPGVYDPPELCGMYDGKFTETAPVFGFEVIVSINSDIKFQYLR